MIMQSICEIFLKEGGLNRFFVMWTIRKLMVKWRNGLIFMSIIEVDMIVLTNLFCGIMIGCMEVLMEIC